MPVRDPVGIADKLGADEREPDRCLCGAEAGGEPGAEATGVRSA